MKYILLQRLFYVRFFICFFIGLIASCTSNNRFNHITSIGHEDLTRTKPINVIIYHDKSQNSLKKATHVPDSKAQGVIQKLKSLNDLNKIILKNVTTHEGDWREVADNYFHSDDHNWTIELSHSDLPEIKFQNFSTDIDSSIEVHFRYCQERTIQFANISASTILADREYWLDQFYSLAIHSLYLLMKGNTELMPVEVRDYQGKIIWATLLGETKNYRFILKGETHIYIAPKTDF